MPERCTDVVSPPSPYLPIAHYLAAQEVETLTLSLAQIEAIIGQPLPPSAFQLSGWWRHSGRRYVRAWIALGWKARLHRRERAVIFTRPAPQEE